MKTPEAFLERAGSVSLRTMTSADHSLVDGVLADAFAANAFSRLLLGGGDIRSRLIRLNRRSVRQAENRGTIAEVDGRPAGALIQGQSPKCEPSGLAGLGFMVDALLAMRHRFFAAFGLFHEVSKNHPEWPHRHLTILGVLPEFQGTGVGSALLERFCAEADEANMNSYLETDSDGGKRLYERYGFREVNRTTRNGVAFIYMWRMAKQD